MDTKPENRTHPGCADPDGSCFAADELREALDVVDARAVAFPLAEPGSDRAANDHMLAAAEEAEGRLVPAAPTLRRSEPVSSGRTGRP